MSLWARLLTLVTTFLCLPCVHGDTTIRLAYLTQHEKGAFKHDGGAFFLAKEDRQDELDSFNITVQSYLKDTEGKDYLAYKQMIDLTTSNNVTAFFGPSHDCACPTSLSTALKVPYVAYDCVYTPNKPNLTDYLVVMTQPADVKVERFIRAILVHFKWNTFTIISGASDMWKETGRLIRGATPNFVKINEYSENDYYNPQYNENTFKDMIRKTCNETRVYVYLGNYHSLIHFLVAMQELGLTDTGEYVVIATNLGKKVMTSNSKSSFRTYEEKTKDISVERLKAFRNVLVLMRRANDNEAADQNSKRLDDRNFLPPINLYRPAIIRHKTPPMSLSAAYLYDGVSLYLDAVIQVVNKSGNVHDPSQIMAEMRNKRYQSWLGLEMYIDDQGDNDGNYTLWSIGMNGGTPLPKMVPIGIFIKDENNSSKVNVEYYPNKMTGIGWINGNPPADVPECGFKGEKCASTSQPVVVIVCSVLGVAIAVAIMVFVFRHYMYEQKLDRLLWKVDRSEIKFLDERDLDACRRPKKINHRWAKLLGKDSGELEDLCVPAPRVEQELTMGKYRETQVVIKIVTKKTLEINRSLKKQLQLRKELTHENINRFVGACIETPQIYILSQYCLRRSLHDIIQNENSPRDEVFIASLLTDLIKGMTFIHDSAIVSHGNLKSSNCLVDSRWVLQIAEFGLHSLYSSSQSIKDQVNYNRLKWKAPELLRSGSHEPRGSQKGDVYSFALILYDIHGRQGPWGAIDMSSKEIVQKVKESEHDAPFRPSVEDLRCKDYILTCMMECWAENPEVRPDFKLIKHKLRDMHAGMKNNIFDNMIAMMGKYADTLEQKVEERTQELFLEKKMTENLLLRMLPRSVAERLKQDQPVIPEQYECVSIYFSDVVGFTSISAQSTPMQVVDLLNDLYICFDSVIENFDVYKVETIGDAYMVVSGLPIRNEDRHAGEVASLSLSVLNRIRNFRIRHMPEASVQIRIGLHSGPCCAGVVGIKMPRYCLFGDTVNTASRMESTGEAMTIHCSQQCKEKLDHLGGYVLQERGIVNMKGKGEQKTYFLVGEDPAQRVRRISQDKLREGRCVSMGNMDYTGKPLLNSNALKNNRVHNSYLSAKSPSVDKLPVTQEVVNMGDDQEDSHETISLLALPGSGHMRVMFQDDKRARPDRTLSCGDVKLEHGNPWQRAAFTRSNSRT